MFLLTTVGRPAPAPDPSAAGAAPRVRIYQLLPRLFGNTNLALKSGGAMTVNGCGKFADISPVALRSLKEMGVTHVWLTGVLQQATRADYSAIGEPPDDADIVKGSAGSPYAIRDYFDVCPDYAVNPKERRREFTQLVERCHTEGLKVIIDLVPNHVARSYASTVEPGSEFGTRGRGRGGKGDDTTVFFDPNNNFFYLPADSQGPPLLLPPAKDGDGKFALEEKAGRVTGNNVASWRPGRDDWYETVKLNFGFDYKSRTKSYPANPAPGDTQVPDTWLKMDAILAYWQTAGVDGFRCDMAHMVPAEFWTWAIARARSRQPEAWFGAEAYKDDPGRVPGGSGDVLVDLLRAGFNTVYDDASYDTLKGIYDGQKWANDIDGARGTDEFAARALRYGENHDEVRLAHPKEWGGAGMDVGRAVTGLLFALSTGPVLIYHGQEVGEPALGTEGFGGDDARTSIFDYWAMPELAKWFNGGACNGGGLSDAQRALRDFYGRLLRLSADPAFARGGFHGLNAANRENTGFGRSPGETFSGHHVYACLRHDPVVKDRYLVIVNLHKERALDNVRIQFSEAALDFLNLPRSNAIERDRVVTFAEKLSMPGVITVQAPVSALVDPSVGITVPLIPPLTPLYLKITAEQ